MSSKEDLEAKLIMLFSPFIEEENKRYSEEKCARNIVYLFKDNIEFTEYFIKNGVDDISKDLLELCKKKTTKKGTIIALKYLCDHIIKRYKLKKELTQSEIDDIHSREKITPREMLKEWESIDYCAPGDTMGSAKDRCKTFSNCHECLLDFAYSKKEYDKLKLEPVNMESFKILQKSKKQ